MTGFDELNDFDDSTDWGDADDWQGDPFGQDQDTTQSDASSSSASDISDGFNDDDIQRSVGNTVSGRSDQDFTSGGDQLESNGKADTAKAAVLVIILGVVIVLVALIAWRLLSQPQSDSVTSENNDQTIQQSDDTDMSDMQIDSNQDNVNSDDEQANQTPQIGTQTTQNYQTSGQNVVGSSQSDSEWQEFSLEASDGNVVYNTEYSQAEFTITSIKNYVAISDQNSSYIRIKSTLTGQISGCPGVYEIDVPYSIGQALKVGQRFDVQVLYGTYGNKTVIGDIRYY